MINYPDIPSDLIKSINASLEFACLLKAKKDILATNLSGGCPIAFDSVLCWPKTPPATKAILPCFDEFKGVHYDSTQNATRYCHRNGTWDQYSNYDQCQHLSETQISNLPPAIEISTIIYCCGYIFSLVTLSLALCVFIYFKDLKCLRNTIHANLFLTYILSAFLWILTLFLQLTEHPNLTGCILLVILFHYFNLTNFFWMLVEGLYLYTLVVQTFSNDKISFKMYAFIGWGCPAIIVLIWSAAKIYAPPLETSDFIGLQIECSWMRESHIDWIFQGPACLVLILNLIFLIRIMWIYILSLKVLITKLRSANTLETRQYRKASKALLVLIPLLGITYLLILTGPEYGLERHMFDIIRAVLISTQGFSVSLFYCFLNFEVRQALRHKFERWQDERNIGNTHSNSNRRDYSRRSRTESLRLTTTTLQIPLQAE